jgi:hypothetical protein
MLELVALTKLEKKHIIYGEQRPLFGNHAQDRQASVAEI